MNTTIQKLVLLSILIALLFSLGSGIYDENSTQNDSDGEARILSSTEGSGAASQEDGTLWEAQFELVNRTTSTSMAGQLKNVTFHKTVEDGEKRYGVSFTGHVQTPTPCHLVEHEVTEKNGTYTFVVTSRPSGEMCIQVLATATYHAEFETDQAFTLHVRHGDMVVDTLESPQPADEVSEHPNEPGRPSLIEIILSWLNHLF